MRIEILSLRNLPELLDLYSAIPDPSPFQHPNWWAFLAEAFRVKVHVLAAREASGSLAGYLLLYETGNIFAGPHLSSLDDGMLVQEDTATTPLLAAARDLHRRSGKRYLLIRGGPWDGVHPSLSASVVRTIVPIERGTVSVWQQMSGNTRRKIRKSKKNGFEVSIKHDAESFAKFGKHFAENQRRLGTPIFGSAVLDKIRIRLSPLLHLLEISRNGKSCGGMLVIVGRKRWCSLYVAMQKDALALYATYQLYWSAIETAAAAGMTTFDLGRSRLDSGTHRFKQAWAGFDELITYRYWYRGAPPAVAPFRDGLATSIQRQLWMRLPSLIARPVGALIRRDLPFL